MTRKFEINQDLDSYLSRVRKKPKGSAVANIFKRKPQTELKIPDVELTTSTVIEAEPGLVSRILQMFTIRQEESVDLEPPINEPVANEEFDKEMTEIEDTEAKVTMSIWQRLQSLFNFGTFSSSASDEELVDASDQNMTRVVLESPEMEGDIKSMALVTKAVLLRLATEDLREFKTSDDFKSYKAILEKYSMIR